MAKTNFILILLMMITFLLVGCLNSQTPTNNQPTEIKQEKCGDSFCSADESCKTCEKDCGCSPNHICNSYGLCESNQCGDSICSEGENCPQDCGCKVGELFKEPNECTPVALIDQNKLIESLQNYIINKPLLIDKVISISDSIYNKNYAKAVIFKATNGKEYLAYIDSNLNILIVTLNE